MFPFLFLGGGGIYELGITKDLAIISCLFNACCNNALLVFIILQKSSPLLFNLTLVCFKVFIQLFTESFFKI